MSATVKGAEYGSVVPGIGTAIGAGIGGVVDLFGGGGGGYDPKFGNGSNLTPYSGTNADILQAPDGGTPIADLAPYNGPGGSNEAARAYGAADFKAMFGRNPTEVELSQLAPSYMSGDPRFLNRSAGQSSLAAYYQSLASNPTNIAARQQTQWNNAYTQNKDATDTQTNGQFQQLLGRDATDSEKQHFGALLASKQIDEYGLSQLLGQTQEAQNHQTSQYQTQLQGQLQSTQGDYYKNYILPTLQENATQRGQSFDDSGYQNAAVQAGKQQNYDLQNYLAQFGASQYGQSAANSQNVYQQYLDNLYGLQTGNINQQLSQQAYTQQRNSQLQDFQLQQQAYQNYLNNYGKRNNGMGGLIGGLAGAGLGAFGGPAGAAAGYSIGSGLGSAIQGGGNMSYGQPINFSGLGTSWGSGSSKATAGGPLPYGQI